MQQKNSIKRFRKTRNQRKQERAAVVLLTIVFVVLLAVASSLFVKAWDSPAEQHVSGVTYLATVGGDSCGIQN